MSDCLALCEEEVQPPPLDSEGRCGVQVNEIGRLILWRLREYDVAAPNLICIPLRKDKKPVLLFI